MVSKIKNSQLEPEILSILSTLINYPDSIVFADIKLAKPRFIFATHIATHEAIQLFNNEKHCSNTFFAQLLCTLNINTHLNINTINHSFLYVRLRAALLFSMRLNQNKFTYSMSDEANAYYLSLHTKYTLICNKLAPINNYLQ